MRRPSRKARRYSIIVTRKRTARHLKCRRARNARDEQHVIRAPTVFAIESETTRHALVQFLAELRRHAAARYGTKARIDFRFTKQMTAAGTLLLAAELDRINTLTGRRPISCNFPKDPVVAQVLKHVGIFDMLSQYRSCEVTAENVKYWKVDSGNLVDGQRADRAMEGYKELFSDPDRKALYRGLTEAMTNCHHHAYEAERGDGLPNVTRWWMFSQLVENRLVVAICDLGIGIPRSLRINAAGLLGAIHNIFETWSLKPNDANFIRAAMALGKTRTKESNRGKGLSDLRAVLDGLGGKLQVHSNRGLFEYDSEGDEERCKNFKTFMSINGTLIIWQITVPGGHAP